MAACSTFSIKDFKFCFTEEIFYLIGDSTKGDDHKWAELQMFAAQDSNEESPRSQILLEYFYQNIQ